MQLTFCKKYIFIFLALLSAAAKAQNNEDTTAIKEILREEVFSWNNGDAVTYSQRFAENGTFTNILGMFFTGHQAFLDRHVEIFKGKFHKTTLSQNIVSLRFVRPDVAIVETLTWITGFSKEGAPPGTHLDTKGRLCTRLLQVMVKNKDGWKITVYHNVDVKPGTVVPDVKAGQ
ncbi:SgcJ/EcaC family oxidoreductase [Haliscomenobacter sp.]|uniref:SgcJ/EcaC family oxidoreductase n=1 Tax=Haliscomenobacter sp. TaxID=2717303 RepID=UPI003BAA9466